MASYRCCGLFVAQSEKPVPLSSVAYEVEVKGFASSISVHQTYKNVEATDLECVYGFPMNDQAAVTGFTVKIGDRVLTSQFKKKEEAFKEYSDALKEGHGAYLLDQSDRSDDTFVLSVGRLPPNQECTVSISYVSLLDSVTETKQRLIIPTALSPRYNPNPEKTSGSVAPPEVYRSSVPYTATLKGKIETIESVKTVSSPSHPISVTIESSNVVTIAFGADQQPLDRDLVIDIEVKSNPEHSVFVEKLRDGQYVGMYSFVPKFEKADSAVKSELVFVVDCSGSMAGDRINDAKRTMGIFLRSIPEGCYFNIYSTFQYLFPKSEPYTAKTFAKAKDYAHQTEANLGGTEIMQPLEKIFSSERRSGFARQVFVLTDGDVSNTDAVIALVRSNASSTRVFSFGIGDSPSRSLVNGIANAGNGKAEYAKKGEVLEDKVGRHLSRALQPSVTDAGVLWEGFRNVQQVPSTLPPVFRGDRQIAFAFFEKNATMVGSVDLQVQSKVHQTSIHLGDTTTTEKPFLEKLAARALIAELEMGKKPVQDGGSLQKRSVLAQSDDVPQKVTEISVRHGVMSKYVSLVAVERRDVEKKSSPSPIQLREIPVLRNEPTDYRALLVDACRSSMLSSGPVYAERCMMARPSPRLQLARSCDMDMDLGAPLENVVTAASDITHISGTGAKAKKSHGGLTSKIKGLFSTSASSSSTNVDPNLNARSDLSRRALHMDRNDSATTKEMPLLNKILELQKWDGSWEFSQELEGYLGLTLDAALKTAGQKVAAELLATLLVVAFLKVKFASESNIWQALINKANTFLGKAVSEQEQEKLLSRLEGLV